jgi:hypothetical protein
MSHLSPEVIAALVDEAATPEQASHLSACASCRDELSAVRRIVALAAAERARPGAPLTSWASLSAALHAEGVVGAAPLSLVRGGGSPAVRGGAAPGALDDVVRTLHDRRPYRMARPSWTRWAGMAAAAALLITAGVATGRWSARTLGAGRTVATTQAPRGTEIVPVSTLQNAEQARTMLRTAEESYAQALGFLAANDSAMAPRQIVGATRAEQQYRERLEVLDAAMSQARQALYEAPDDPVMNRYYLATMGAREVLLRRLTSVLPATQQVVEY